MGENQDKNTLQEENMTDLSESVAEPKKRSGLLANIQFILLAAIVFVIGFSAYRLYKWNKGTPSDYDPNYQTTDFDIEVMDNLIPLAPDKREGYVDDGVTTILCLGDDPFSLERGENGLAEQIAKKTGATVYNGSFTGTTMAAQFASYNDGYILDAFSFSYVAKSLASGDFDLMKTAATYSYDENFATTAQMLSELDMNTVDMICVMYDGSDYINRRPCEDPNHPDNPNNPNNPNNPDGDNDNDGNGSVDFEKVGEILKQWWQVVASGISIILIIIFLAKTIGYERRRKEAKKENDERYKTFYAVSGTGLFGLAMTGWTALACILMVSAVASFAIMEVAKTDARKRKRTFIQQRRVQQNDVYAYDGRKRRQYAKRHGSARLCLCSATRTWRGRDKRNSVRNNDRFIAGNATNVTATGVR